MKLALEDVKREELIKMHTGLVLADTCVHFKLLLSIAGLSGLWTWLFVSAVAFSSSLRTPCTCIKKKKINIVSIENRMKQKTHLLQYQKQKIVTPFISGGGTRCCCCCWCLASRYLGLTWMLCGDSPFATVPAAAALEEGGFG